ncbi:uncharacterized protein LOC128995377 [Macrosteles quadrilineatus]|uniref:uncharacterized protein LOC128995377 n=1 Tax=Macrosteles quadrilineatus TaxID=74068 RepID=UPI0023E1F11B|nr:uncharacterized protein LOC128995377 [Macrosteles quadrilineatus]
MITSMLVVLLFLLSTSVGETTDELQQQIYFKDIKCAKLFYEQTPDHQDETRNNYLGCQSELGDLVTRYVQLKATLNHMTDSAWIKKEYNKKEGGEIYESDDLEHFKLKVRHGEGETFVDVPRELYFKPNPEPKPEPDPVKLDKKPPQSETHITFPTVERLRNQQTQSGWKSSQKPAGSLWKSVWKFFFGSN